MQMELRGIISVSRGREWFDDGLKKYTEHDKNIMPTFNYDPSVQLNVS